MKAQLAGICASLLLAAPAFADTYTFTDQSEVKFTATAPMRWNGVHGVSNDVYGRIEIPSNGKLEEAKVGIGVPITSFRAKRGMDLHAFTALEAAKYPAVMFKAKTITIDSRTETPEGTRLTGKIDGYLNFHGVVQPLSTAFTALQGPVESTIDAEFPISLSSHHVEPITVVVITMDDQVKMHIHLVAKKAT
ncbi:MAG TPA: YceI family protein [Stenomitos sp.]